MIMQETSPLDWRIVSATLFSVVLIVGAYMLARSAGSPPIAQASSETALLQAIATRDSNGDGLPDWQKALYGIPLTSTTTDYYHLGMTDGEAVARGLIVPRAIADIAVATSSSSSVIIDPSLPPAPAVGTLTDTFAKTFFSLYMNAKAANNGVELSETQVNDLAAQALATLSSTITSTPNYKSARDLAISGSGADVLRAFAASAEAVILKNKSDTNKNEILYLQDIVEKNDTTASSHLVSIAKAYRDSAVGLAALPVPSELAANDLVLINTMIRLSEITSDFARVNTDPLPAMIALQQYMPTSQALANVFSDIATTYAASGVTLPTGTPGALFVNMVANLKALISHE
jgi:hypothetical protein